MFTPDMVRALSQGGAAIAVIAVVVLFLQHQKQMYGVIQDLAKHFTTEVSAVRDSFAVALDKSQERFQNQLNVIHGETIHSIDRLEISVEELRGEVAQIKKG